MNTYLNNCCNFIYKLWDNVVIVDEILMSMFITSMFKLTILNLAELMRSSEVLGSQVGLGLV